MRATALLGDRQWHPFDKVMYEMMQTVPQGVAKQHYEHTFLYERRRKGVALDRPPHRFRTDAQRIEIGRRQIVTDFLANNTIFETNRRGTKRQDPRLPERKIRMLKEHRESRKDPIRAAAEDALYDVALLHDAVNALRRYISDAGLPDPVGSLGIVIPQQHGERGNT